MRSYCPVARRQNLVIHGASVGVKVCLHSLGEAVVGNRRNVGHAGGVRGVGKVIFAVN